MSPITPEQVASRTSREPAEGAALEAADTAAQLSRLITALPANQQEVLRLKFQESLGYRDIATITGLSVTNVGYLLHTALKTVRQRMAEQGESD